MMRPLLSVDVIKMSISQCSAHKTLIFSLSRADCFISHIVVRLSSLYMPQQEKKMITKYAVKQIYSNMQCKISPCNDVKKQKQNIVKIKCYIRAFLSYAFGMILENIDTLAMTDSSGRIATATEKSRQSITHRAAVLDMLGFRICVFLM